MCETGGLSAEEKYHIFMRHRYSSCVETLLEHLDHELHRVRVREPGAETHTHTHRLRGRDTNPHFTLFLWHKLLQESALCCLMQLAAAEGQNPLEDLDWTEHYSFPRELVVVGSRWVVWGTCFAAPVRDASAGFSSRQWSNVSCPKATTRPC